MTSLECHQARYRHWRLFSIHRRSASKTMLSVGSFIHMICSLSWCVIVRHRVLSGILKQVTRLWRFCAIHIRSASKTMLSVRSFIRMFCSRSWFVFVRYRFSQVPSSRYPRSKIFFNSSPRVVNNVITAKLFSSEMFSVMLHICTVSVLSDIIKQGTLHWGLCSIHRRSESVQSFIRTI